MVINAIEEMGKIPYSGQLLNNRNILLTVIEAGKSKIKASGVWKGLIFLFLDDPFMLSPQMVGEASELLCAYFVRALIPLMRAPFSCPSHCPQGHYLGSYDFNI
jgi:hypothetical protein